MKTGKSKQKTERGLASFTIIIAFLCFSLVGLVLMPMLSVKLSPSRTLQSLGISYSMPGNSSRIIEAEVTSRLEAMLSRVEGVKRIHSTSNNGSGSITLDMDKRADMDAVRFEVSTIVRQIWPQLPKGVSYPQIWTSRSNDKASRPFMSYTLNAPASPILIMRYAENHIKPVLGQLKGVQNVELSGATPMQWQLEYDNMQLASLGIGMNDILTAIQEHYGKEFLGICPMEKGTEGREWIRLLRISVEGETGFHPERILLKTADGSIIGLDKLIRVRHIEAEPTGYYRINGLNSIYLNITAQESANQLELGKEVRQKMAELEHNMPKGYEVHSGYDATEYISQELDKIYFRTGLTILILLAFVLLVTRSMRYLMLITASLSVNLAIAFILYYALEVEMQLYSLAGITISLNLVIDNIIVMADHIRHRHNLKAFLAILAATLTTVGALGIVFFLEERMRMEVQDFAAVVIINLVVSLLVALFFVPALMEKSGMLMYKQKTSAYRFRRILCVCNHMYLGIIGWLGRYRVVACGMLILAFGLPVFLMPERMNEEDGMLAIYYNKVFDNAVYKEKIRPIVDKALGGTLRLFVEDVYTGSYFNREEGEPVLSVYASLPNGNTLEQMNTLIKKMESYLSKFSEIRQFQTSIYNARHATIQIYFEKEYQTGTFPYTLKSEIISKALQLGGGSWSVYGLKEQGFSNEVHETAGTFRVKMNGYNYDELSHWGERLKERLLEHRRIKEVTIGAEFSFWKDDYSEFYLDMNKELLARQNISSIQLFTALNSVFGKDISCGNIIYENHLEALKLNSHQGKEYDVWSLVNVPVHINGNPYKLADFASIKKGASAQKIVKEDQQYQLCLQYNYIGSGSTGQRLLKRELEQLRQEMPMGYTAEIEQANYSWGKKENKQYVLLLIVIAIIFFITSILFNSLRQPLAIILVIPISYIGVFLTFYLFDLNFDQGGFASLVLLCGITVNASIYILNEYNNLCQRSPRQTPVRCYVKACNAKIIPILLTVLSTILGFIPFMVGTDKTAFWFPLAAGTIGGLIMSLLGVFLFLPLYSLPDNKNI